MYDIKEENVDILLSKKVLDNIESPFCTYEWMCFLEKNQKVKPVVLQLEKNGDIIALFVGGVIKKGFIKILASPFEGWLTPDMGFICFNKINLEEAILSIKNYAFKNLKCLLLQIIDKKFVGCDLNIKGVHLDNVKLLYINNDVTQEQIMSNFTSNGRRDIRASSRKGLEFRKVDFNNEFAENYYKQLEEVFRKQNLKPFYTIDKVYDLVKAFKYIPERVFAICAYYQDKCVATVFSFGYGDWAYYMGAASYREYQKYLPNEGLFWEFVKHWNNQGIKNIDLVGYRPYKMKYNPEIKEVPVVVFQRFPFVLLVKKLFKNIIMSIRKIKGLLIKQV